MQVAPPILEVRDLGRRAEDDGEWLLHDINLKISAGDRIGLVGLSGSGKTLLLRSLAMLDPCSTGEIFFVANLSTTGRYHASAHRQSICISIRSFSKAR